MAMRVNAPTRRAFARKIIYGVLLVFVSGVFFAAFQYYRYLPRGDVSIKTLSGFTVYNMSGEPITDYEWAMYFHNIRQGYETFKNCLELEKEAEKLRGVDIVVIPSRTIPLFEQHVVGFSLFKNVFVRRGRFNFNTVRHEFIHVYLYLKADSFWDNPLVFFRQLGINLLHINPLFKKCDDYKIN